MQYLTYSRKITPTDEFRDYVCRDRASLAECRGRGSELFKLRAALRHPTIPPTQQQIGWFNYLRGRLASHKHALAVPHLVTHTLTYSRRGLIGVAHFAAHHSFLDRMERRYLRDLLKERIRVNRTLQKTRHVTWVERDVFGGVTIQMIGGVHIKEGAIMALKSKRKDLEKRRKREAVRRSKSPKTPVKHVGVEIEFCSYASPGELTDAFIEEGLEEFVTLKEDGSVQPETSECECSPCECCNEVHECECGASGQSEDYGHEVCILAPQARVSGIVKRVCKILSDHNAYVNRTCGLHVHLDMRRRDKDQAFKNLVLAYPVLAAMVPRQRRDNDFCNPPSSTSIDTALNYTGRYQAINPHALDQHSTLEVRLHSGTTNHKKIAAWIRVLIKIAEAGDFGNAEIRTLTMLAALVRLPKTLRQYMSKRIEKFSNSVSSQLDENAA